MNEEFDFIALGDIVTDAFIRIKQASIHHDDPDGLEKICLTNGSKIPYEFFVVLAAVGNSPNAAVSATRLGLKTALVTDLGDDQYGQEDLETLKKNGIDARFARVHSGKISNYHFVLWHKAERTILIKHEEYPYSLPDIGTPRWMYLSSLGENSLPYHDEIAKYLPGIIESLERHYNDPVIAPNGKLEGMCLAIRGLKGLLAKAKGENI